MNYYKTKRRLHMVHTTTVTMDFFIQREITFYTYKSRMMNKYHTIGL